MYVLTEQTIKGVILMQKFFNKEDRLQNYLNSRYESQDVYGLTAIGEIYFPDSDVLVTLKEVDFS